MKRKRSNEKITVYCAVCGKEKIITPCRYKEGKNFFCGPEHQKEAQKGRTLSDETKKRISESKGGIKKETRICEGCGIEFEIEKWKKNRFHSRECGCRFVGKKSHSNSWRKGLSLDDPKMVAATKKQSETLLQLYKDGTIKPWNEGLTAETDERVADYVKKQTDWRNTDSDAKDAWKQAMSKGQVQAHAAGKYPHTFTIPEQLTWAHLESLGYTVKPWADKSDNDPENTWYHQYNFENAFVPDFACPDLKGVIEVNGCHHHGHDVVKCQHRTAKYKRAETDYVKDNIKRDRRKYSMYHRHGWKWALVWECEAAQGDFHRIEEYLK